MNFRKSKNIGVKCQTDGELPLGRKAKACGRYSASRFIRCKALKISFFLPLPYVSIGEKEDFLCLKKDIAHSKA